MKTITAREFIQKCISAGAWEASDEHLGNANIHRPDIDALEAELTAFAEAYHKAMLEASPPVEVIGVSAWECSGCGTITNSVDKYMELLRRAGHLSCCPDHTYKMLTLYPVTPPVAS